MSNLQPTPIVDKNGKQTTVRKRMDHSVPVSRLSNVSQPINNTFARCNTREELEDLYDMFTSPENISHDGERSQADIKKAMTHFNKHYKARAAELGIKL